MRLSTNMMFDQQMRGVSNAQSSWLKAGSSFHRQTGCQPV